MFFMDFKIVAFLGIIISVHSQDLQCYQCDPRSTGKCESPDKNNITAVACPEIHQTAIANATKMETLILNLEQNATQKPFCFYLYFDAGIPEQTGYYRGCSRYSERVLKFCKSLNNRLGESFNETMRDCQICNVSGCNTGSFGLFQGKTLIGVIGDAKETSTNTSTVKSNKSGTSEVYYSLSLVINLVIGFCLLRF